MAKRLTPKDKQLINATNPTMVTWRDSLDWFISLGYELEAVAEKPKYEDIKENTIYLYLIDNKLEYVVKSPNGNIKTIEIKDSQNTVIHERRQDIIKKLQNKESFQQEDKESIFRDFIDDYPQYAGNQGQDAALYEDAKRRQGYFDGKSFFYGIYTDEKLNEEDKKKAFPDFLRDTLFPEEKEDKFTNNKDHLKLKKFFKQDMGTKFKEAIIRSIQQGHPEEILLPEPSLISNITRDTRGNIYLDVILYDIKVKNPMAAENESVTKYQLPGTITSRFILTDKGFKLEWVEASNNLLEKLCLNQAVHIAEKEITQENKKEFDAFEYAINHCTIPNTNKLGSNILNQFCMILNQKDIIEKIDRVIQNHKENDDKQFSLYMQLSNSITILKQILQNPLNENISVALFDIEKNIKHRFSSLEKDTLLNPFIKQIDRLYDNVLLLLGESQILNGKYKSTSKELFNTLITYNENDDKHKLALKKAGMNLFNEIDTIVKSSNELTIDPDKLIQILRDTKSLIENPNPSAKDIGDYLKLAASVRDTSTFAALFKGTHPIRKEMEKIADLALARNKLTKSPTRPPTNDRH